MRDHSGHLQPSRIRYSGPSSPTWCRKSTTPLGRGQGTETVASGLSLPPQRGGGAGSHPTTSFADPTHRPDPPRPSCPGSFRHSCPTIPTTPCPVWGLCPEPCFLQPDPQGLPSLQKAPRPPPLDLVHPGTPPRPGQRGWASGACALGDPAPGTWTAGSPRRMLRGFDPS